MGGTVRINFGHKRMVPFKERIAAARKSNVELIDNVFFSSAQDIFFHVCAEGEEFSTENGMMDVGGVIDFKSEHPFCWRCEEKIDKKVGTVRKMKTFGNI